MIHLEQISLVPSGRDRDGSWTTFFRKFPTLVAASPVRFHLVVSDAAEMTTGDPFLMMVSMNFLDMILFVPDMADERDDHETVKWSGWRSKMRINSGKFYDFGYFEPSQWSFIVWEVNSWERGKCIDQVREVIYLLFASIVKVSEPVPVGVNGIVTGKCRPPIKE